MNMLEKWCCKPWGHNKSLGLLILRLALAAVFIAHGWGKFKNMEGTVAFFGQIGLAPFFAYLVAAVELVGGIAMLLGAFAPLAGWLIAIVMLFSIILVKGKMGFIGGYAYDLILLAAALTVAFAGSGKYSVCKGCRHGGPDECCEKCGKCGGECSCGAPTGGMMK